MTEQDVCAVWEFWEKCVPDVHDARYVTGVCGRCGAPANGGVDAFWEYWFWKIAQVFLQ